MCYAYANDQAQGIKKELYCEILPVVIVDYNYDKLGRRTTVSNTGTAFSSAKFNEFGYNDRSELTSSNRYTGTLGDTSQPVTAEARAYAYDPIGNRKTVTGAAKQLTYTANQLNQYTLITAPVEASPGYDADGNLISAPAGIAGAADTVLKYDAENRLISVEPQAPASGSTKVEFVYDYMSRRAAKKVFDYAGGAWSLQSTSTFIYEGWNLIREVITPTPDPGTPAPVFYIWGLDLSGTLQGAGGIGGLLARVKEGAAQQYTFDGNGNVSELLNNDGSIAAHYEYDPYGNAIVATGDNPFRWSTKFFDDETGLLYYGYRFYSPVLGRWLSRDPLGELGGLNVYGFVNNQPNLLTDSVGLSFGSTIETIRDLIKWALGIVDERILYETDPITQEIKASPQMDEIRKRYKKADCKPGVYPGNWPMSKIAPASLLKQFITGEFNLVWHSVGSFLAALNNDGDTTQVKAWNDWGLESFTRTGNDNRPLLSKIIQIGCFGQAKCLILH